MISQLEPVWWLCHNYSSIQAEKYLHLSMWSRSFFWIMKGSGKGSTMVTCEVCIHLQRHKGYIHARYPKLSRTHGEMNTLVLVILYSVLNEIFSKFVLL